MRSLALIVLIAVPMAVAPAAFAEQRVIRYVVGGATDNPLPVGPAALAACAGPSAVLVVGGACYIAQPPGSAVTILVWDEMKGGVPFWWSACEWPPAEGGAWANGSTSTTLPGTCGALLVSPGVGAVVGTIRVGPQ